MEIEVGSIYRLDHCSNLHTSTTLPESLSSIKAVLVDQKTDEEVTLSFPSSESLMRFFGAEKRSGSMQPNLDERCVISLNASKILLTEKISFEVFAAQRGTRIFWSLDFLDDQDHDEDDDDDDDHPISSSAGLEIKWGRRRRATFYGKHRTSILPCDVTKGEETAMAKSLKNEDDEREEEDEDDDKEEFTDSVRRTVKKRKCQFKGVKYTDQKKKRKQAKGSSTTSTHDHEKKPTNPQHRWTAERYKLAERNMLKIMKAKGAVPGNPILRPELRSEARKLIGDTGLLDHLLKHMAGKLAPGGKERFRRRHNPEGAMEYWLEGGDLVEIRKKASIKDPYWVPPPGWKLGDNPTQDPTCAKELMLLKEEVANMKREMENLVCKEKAKNDQTLMAAPTPCEGFGRLNFEGSLQPLKGIYEELMKKKAGIEKQLFDISKSLSGMEEEIRSMAKDEGTKGLAEKGKKQGKGNTYSGAINEAEEDTQLLQFKDKSSDEQKQQSAKNPQPPPPPPPAGTTCTATTDDFERREKQERRQRLKSGFRICKPQGTFLWPNSNSQVAEDLLSLGGGYPTPPSVSSSPTSPTSSFFLLPDHHHHQPHCDEAAAVVVKKPVAKRAAVTLTYSTASIRGSTTIESISSPTSTTIASCSSSTITNTSTTTTTTNGHQIFVPDLNEAPPSIISAFT